MAVAAEAAECVEVAGEGEVVLVGVAAEECAGVVAAPDGCPAVVVISEVAAAHRETWEEVPAWAAVAVPSVGEGLTAGAGWTGVDALTAPAGEALMARAAGDVSMASEVEGLMVPDVGSTAPAAVASTAWLVAVLMGPVTSQARATCLGLTSRSLPTEVFRVTAWVAVP